MAGLIGRIGGFVVLLIMSLAVGALVPVQKDPDHEMTESLLAILFVWFAAAIAHLLLFRDATREPRKKREEEEASTPRG